MLFNLKSPSHDLQRDVSLELNDLITIIKVPGKGHYLCTLDLP